MIKSIFQVVTDDVNIEGTFLEISEAVKLKKMLEQCPEEYISPIEIKEVRFTDLTKLKVRTFICGTINLATGQIGQFLEAKRVTDFTGDCTVHVAKDYIEINYYGNMVAAVEVLKKLREEAIKGK